MVMRLVQGVGVLYGLIFIGGMIAAGGSLPVWFEWANGAYMILGGTTALLWYAGRYGNRQTLFLFVISASVSYAADWISSHSGRLFGEGGSGLSLTPLVFGVPMALPFAWCMLLIIAKAFAPVRSPRQAWQGLSLTEFESPGKERLLRSRKWRRRRSFWLPGLWGAALITSVHLLLSPVSVNYSNGNGRAAAGPDSMADLYEIPLGRFFCWWAMALVIINFINYLHDEYFAETDSRFGGSKLIPAMLLLTLEAFFLTLAVRSELWWPAALNVLLLGILYLWKRSEEKG
ncbi:carotenoid biosynthesis protein [Paenibacillus sp. P26]|nr:carotenoid biosynthesis protein [Paenibacillus sp. P26]